MTEIVDFTSETVIHGIIGDDIYRLIIYLIYDIKYHRGGIYFTTLIILEDASLSKFTVGNTGRNARRNFSQQTVS